MGGDGTQGSVVFDRAADYYDRTRAIPAEATAEVVRLVTAEVGDRRCLEIGVGTGRIALPLTRAGLRMVGADLSRPMLDRLVANAGGEPPLHLVQADAARLPFGDDLFGAALAVHVFHLLEGWRDVVAELRRVVADGGVVLVSRPRQAQAIRAVQGRFMEELGLDRLFPGADVDDLDGAFGELGADIHDFPEVDVSRTTTLERVIAAIEEQRWSWTWQVDAEAIRDAAVRVRDWAATAVAPLEQPLDTEMRMVLRSYTFPAPSR
jgi:SAM-dependent methyltransferase